MPAKYKVWETDNYYDHARKASLDISHPAMKLLKKISKNKKILDLGCGEGTRLAYLSRQTRKKSTGIDISKKAISLAKKKDKKNVYKVGNLEKLSLNNEEFDLVYSAFVLEHTDDTKKVIDEAIRVLNKNGDLVFVCPNFGAPNRVSPPNIDAKRLIKLIIGFFYDLKLLFIKNTDLKWNKVTPIKGEYFSDSDTTIEPYVLTLKNYLENRGLQTKLASSLWSEELANANLMQKIFKILGENNIYPFKYWGPHLLIHAKKSGY